MTQQNDPLTNLHLMYDVLKKTNEFILESECHTNDFIASLSQHGYDESVLWAFQAARAEQMRQLLEVQRTAQAQLNSKAGVSL